MSHLMRYLGLPITQEGVCQLLKQVVMANEGKPDNEKVYFALGELRAMTAATGDSERSIWKKIYAQIKAGKGMITLLDFVANELSEANQREADSQ